MQKVHKLIELNQMKPEGLTIFNQRNDQTGYSSANRNVTLIKEYEDEIKKIKILGNSLISFRILTKEILFGG